MTRTRYLLRQVQTPRNRMEMARILVELAENAERNPALQKLLKRLKLPSPYDVLEYREPGNKKGSWARKPYTREHPAKTQLETRLAFSEVAYSLFGNRGVVERPDGTRIPRNVFMQGNVMRGMKFVSEIDKAERQRQKAVDRIAEAVAPTY